MKKITNLIAPDIEILAKKDSDISTKRYADLRIVYHFVLQSWAILIVLIYFQQWDGIKVHTIILGTFAFLRGVLASGENLLKIIETFKK